MAHKDSERLDFSHLDRYLDQLFTKKTTQPFY